MSARVLDKPCLDHGFKGKSGGYAEVRRPTGRDKKVLYHRYVFLQAHGFLPPVVMHRCDNTRCIEVTHLEAGDWGKNNKDRAAKGRSAKNVPTRRKLTFEQAQEIRERFVGRGGRDPVNGVSALAREFGVDCNVIYQITDGRTHRA